jgi:hypothetical protein
VTDKELSRFLGVCIVACLVLLAFLGTLGLGIRLIEWAFSA